MRDIEVYIGPTVNIEDINNRGKGIEEGEDSEYCIDIAQLELLDKDKVVWMLYLTSAAKDIVKCLKDDPLFNEEEVNLKVYGFMPAQDKKEDEFYTKIYEFKGTIYDALLIAANEGAKYDRA